MTGYGRGPGSEPWHPEDPLYGDQGWGGQPTDGAQHPQPHQQPQAHPEPHAQPYGNQQYQYQEHAAYGAQQYDGRQYDGQPYTGQPYGGQQFNGQQYDGGWETGQQAAMPYGAPPAPAAPYGGADPDPYRTPEAYPPPQPPGQRRPADPEPSYEEEREPEPEEENHPFFSNGDGDGDDADRDDPEADDPASTRSKRRGRSRNTKGAKDSPKGKKRKSRNGVACLVVALVLAGGAGGVAYFGYQFWQSQFGAAPDFEGTGTSETVQVTIPQGAGGYEIGSILVKNGVVKSQGAFVSAQSKHPKGKNIQAGVYTLKKGMSATSAVELMLNPQSQSTLIIPEGRRNAWVYEQIDKKLQLKAGTTEAVAAAEAKNLGLPAWATGHRDVKDPLEGFLFPASYPVAKGAKPEDVLKKMVARAKAEYIKADLEGKAKTLGLKSPWELLTVASLVQVEGKTDDDFRRMSEVVYNRLKPTNTETNQLLQFDSAFNYLQGESNIDISETEINSNQDPYNTYTQKGLTPGPISNPGIEALEAAMNPTKEGWMYFVATDGMNKTEFAKTHDEFLKLKDKFNDSKGRD
ncbi:endolytic transglycosylase MltG [Streptomyces sp. NPDC045431]|uniref:endolytic transglycosylase MltG n=1 Tax=Streptomyces sp. NPDC045431 TaxID=3155613 RepID=UPI0033D182F2